MAERNILEEIVDYRKRDIAELGWEFGFDIPQTRQRPVHTFLQTKGVILEVKRASPSKGDIAPELDSGATARSYAESGASAISCLTETRYFKGTLQDLMNVCQSVDAYEKETGKNGPAVLRKDFLIDEKDIDVAYRAGADAVLLIARILPVEKMISMAEKCQELGITALVELRLEEDVAKLEQVVKTVDPRYLAAGVNSRDLRDFTIDLLTPCTILHRIRAVLGEHARVIFESGIRTPESAAFAGSLGFAGLLLGEAAAKNPELRSAFVRSFVDSKETPNARFWNRYAVLKESAGRRPLVKMCGLTTVGDAEKSAELGATILGFIFWKKSARQATEEVVRQVRCAVDEQYGAQNAAGCHRPLLAGVIVNPADDEAQTAIRLVQEGVLDVLQLHTMDCARAFIARDDYRCLPHYAAVNISSEDDVVQLEELFEMGEPRCLVDAQTGGKIGGTGKQISSELVQLVQKTYRLWLAGGLSPETVGNAVTAFQPELIDCASGTESEPGVKDHDKLERFFQAAQHCAF